MYQSRSAACHLAICVFLLGVPSGAPAGVSQDASLPAPTLRVSTHLVLLDVVVTDKTGKPMTGLSSDDFTVKESGKPQKISFFTAPTQTVAPLAPALPPGVYSNAPAYRTAGGPPTVIVLDAANTQYRDQAFARLQMLKFVSNQYKPGQRIAIFTLTNKLSLVQDFTDNPDVLRAALEKMRGTETELSKASAPALETPQTAPPAGLQFASLQVQSAFSALRRFQEVELQYEKDRRTEATLAAMRSLNRVLGGLPGRKNIIWLTAGFPFSLIPEQDDSHRSEIMMRSLHERIPPNLTENYEYAEKIREVAAQMATSQVAIYPVDVRGLAVSPREDPVSNQQTMREIAEETGGRAFINRNDIDDGVALVLRDHSATYTIGYYPQNKNFSRNYRSINIKLSRPGLETAYRRGYYAIDPASGKDKKLDQELADAWRDQAPDTLVTFEARTDAGEHGKTRVEFQVDPGSLSTTDDPSGKKFDVGFYAAAFSPEGKALSSQAVKLDRAFPPGTYQKIMEQGLRIHFDIDTPPGCNELQLAVRDNRTGYMGTLRLPTAGNKRAD